MLSLVPRFVHTIFLLLICAVSLHAQERKVGLMLNEDGAYPGYTMFSQLSGSTTYLIDNEGMVVHTWDFDLPPANTQYLFENGNLLRTADPAGNDVILAGGDGGRVELYTWDGVLLWVYELNTPQERLHHDIEPLANGNFLLIAWEYRSEEEAIEAGRDPELITEGAVWPEQILEIKPGPHNTSEVVWRWRVWDHIVQDYDSTKPNFGDPSEHPELIDLNYRLNGGADWIHANAVEYNPGLQQIVISTPNYHEIWIIDHSTTTEEAAGHEGGRYGKGGDLLYRWGNPEAYGAGTPDDKQLFGQHDARWIPEGLPGESNMLIFDNGRDRPTGEYSRIVEIELPQNPDGSYILEPGEAFGPEAPTWQYMAEDSLSFYSRILSGAQRLPNGNTLIGSGVPGRIFEVTPEGQVVWEYVNPVTTSGILTVTDDPTDLDNRIFRATRFDFDYPAFDGKDLTPMGPIELSPVASTHEVPSAQGRNLRLLGNYPNPVQSQTQIRFEVTRPGPVTIRILDALGRRIDTVSDGVYRSSGVHSVGYRPGDLPPGVYLFAVDAGAAIQTGKMVLTR
jgi:hypothetical protein